MTQTERLHFLLTELTQEDPVYEGVRLHPLRRSKSGCFVL